MSGKKEKIRVGVDIGGTFTDVVLINQGELTAAKVPTTDDQSIGAIKGIKKACSKADVYASKISEFIHCMTVPINAVLEKSGAKTALITTQGFRDIVEIRRQDRPSLYDLDAEKPEPLVPRRYRFEIEERSFPNKIDERIEENEARKIADKIGSKEIESVAVSFLHSYSNPENERKIKKLLNKELDVPVSISSEVLAEFREYERTSTTVLDAYITPKIQGYLSRLSDRSIEAGIPTPKIMQSNGGISDIDNIQEVKTIIPAAGAVGVPVISNNAIAIDMGGTSCDISLIQNGEVEKTTETKINQYPIKTPTINVKTVGSGGGSIAWVDDGGALRVGPKSAGANPGPVCYGKGGDRPTVTDANLILGYIGSGTDLGGEISIDKEAAKDSIEELSEKLDIECIFETAMGIHKIANTNIAQGIRSLTVKRGKDPREFEIVSLGGAGPIHAAVLADELNIKKVKIPLTAGVFSAFSLLVADEKKDTVRTYLRDLEDIDEGQLQDIYESLEEEVKSKISDPHKAKIERAADIRYIGQSFELVVDVEKPFNKKRLEKKFHDKHKTQRGYMMDESVEVVNLRINVTIERENPENIYQSKDEGFKNYREVFFDGWYETPIYRRRNISPGEIEGPAVFEEEETTILVPPCWKSKINDDGTVILLKNGC